MKKLACLIFLSAFALAACGEKPAESAAQDSGKAADQGAEQESAQQGYVDSMAEQHAVDTPEASGAETLGEIPAVPVLSENVAYAQIDGRDVTGYLAYPESAHGGLPGVLMFHEWWGLNDNIRAMADKLAAQGYVVLALDMYQGQVAETPERARELMQPVMSEPARVNDNIRQAYKFMTEEIGALSVASLGWCLGGTLSFNAALLFPQELDGVVVYYGFVTDVSRAQLETLQMPVLGIFGGEDGGIPVDGVKAFRDALKALGKDAEIVIYEGVGHAFANPSGQNYQPEAAEDAWQRTLKFLDRSLNAAVNRNVLEPEQAADAAPQTAR